MQPKQMLSESLNVAYPIFTVTYTETGKRVIYPRIKEIEVRQFK